MKTIIKILIIFIIILLLFPVLFSKRGFGLLKRNKSSTSSDENTITITVSDKISINGTVVKDLTSLKEQLISTNKDGVSYVLKDDHSTEANYTAVKKVLEDLKLEYTEQ